ncbi:MAG: GIY-YIG nuclease family protein, partial [Candidatus Eremiobacteraeota bacterium]|nr:GIY-YIG nuclease family protein [Candidatus Eremiobacteraeota bacterium]
MKTYYVYMLLCFDGTYYVGVTNNVDRRFWEHCEGIDPECYTYNRRPLKVVWVGPTNSILDAIAYEKVVKDWSRKKKRALIEGRWDDIRRYS